MEKMSNIIDYVRRMKDVPFEIAPLNEIDSLIFSQLAYLDYTPMRIFCKAFFKKNKNDHNMSVFPNLVLRASG